MLYSLNVKPPGLKRSCFAKMADDRFCLHTTVTVEIKQKINMQLKKISRSAEHTIKTIIHEENNKYKTMKTAKIARQRGITQEINVS